jgi:gamma-glutamyltranspeptidase/glutathione hydrolase
MRGVISAGHELTARAGREMLEAGGNAFDAAVAASFASFVTESALTSPAGGGFMITHESGGDISFYDFFVDVPGLGDEAGNDELSFFSVFIEFGNARQELHVGEGSGAVPGNIAGLKKVFDDLCTLPIEKIMAPAIRYARDGIILNDWQAYFNRLLSPILTLMPDATRIYAPQGKPLSAGDTIFNKDMADTLEHLSSDGLDKFYDGFLADAILSAFCARGGGIITGRDLKEYSVRMRTPLEVDYRGRRIFTNPPPSSGGLLIAFALKLLEPYDLEKMGHNSADYIELLSHVMRVTDEFRKEEFDHAVHEEGGDTLLSGLRLDPYREMLSGSIIRDTSSSGGSAFGNTTQISVADDMGNAASITTSTGIGCGVMIPGTGIMMNNMLGEEDLNPKGFHTLSPGKRMSSMMAPTMVMKGDVPEIVLGSGGSKRIRSAILQVILNILDHSMEVGEAVNSSRVHFDDGTLQIEKGLSQQVIEDLSVRMPSVNVWADKNLYFGGVHSVVDLDGEFSGGGDERRGGVSLLSKA